MCTVIFDHTPDCHTYQLRAYLYQARDMYSSDKSGLSDPYAVMAFGRYSTRSRIIKESVCPTWDQTMLINHIRMFGDPRAILETPPPVTVEFFDKDTVVGWGSLPDSLLETLSTLTHKHIICALTHMYTHPGPR